VEVAAPAVAAAVARLVGHLPAALRRRALSGAFSRAQAAFNRGDFEAIFALFADDVRYVPPPALGPTPINGRAAVLAFWRAIGEQFPTSPSRTCPWRKPSRTASSAPPGSRTATTTRHSTTSSGR